jgi:integrase
MEPQRVTQAKNRLRSQIDADLPQRRRRYAGPSGAGADVKLVQALAGHKNPLITLQRYSHLTDARVTEAAHRFDPAAVRTNWAPRRDE